MADSARGTEVKMGNLIQKFCHFIGERLRRRAEGGDKSLIWEANVQVTDIRLRVGLP